MISLALAVVATAVTATAIGELRLAKSDFTQDSLVVALDGAQQRAAYTMLAAGLSNRLRWVDATPQGPVRVLAEAEAPKMGLFAAPNIDNATLEKLQVKDGGALIERLKAMTQADAIGPRLEAADGAPLWRACARSLISAYGDAKAAPILKATAPIIDTSAWHRGDVWRVRVTMAGWVDDRLVRFVGVALRPTVTIDRRFYGATREANQCDALFAS